MRKITSILALLLCAMLAQARPSWELHAKDMYDVFGFKPSTEITEWMRHISSDLIDKVDKELDYTYNGEKVTFYNYLKLKYPGFKCRHRLLFHWGYNSRPWNDLLQAKVEKLNWSPEKIKAFQQEIVNEQRRRNRSANEYTECLFGFASGGKEAAQARALISLAYDVHILGDYVPDDNKDLKGLGSLSSVIGDIINNIRVLDPANNKDIVSKIQKASRTTEDDQVKALRVLEILKKDLRKLLRNHPDKRISKLVVDTEYVAD